MAPAVHQHITRRLFLRNTAAAGAVATTIGAPVIAETAARSSAEEAALHHWHGLMAALRELMPDDCRVTLVGGDMRTIGEGSVRVTAMRTADEEVRPGLIMPIERFAASYHLSGEGWRVIDAI